MIKTLAGNGIKNDNLVELAELISKIDAVILEYDIEDLSYLFKL